MRFHFGVSFRLRNLKKFLFPFIIGLLAYFGFSGIFGNFGFIQTYAYVNTDTSFNIDVDYRTMLESRVCGGVNAYEYIDWLTKQIDWSTSAYQLFIATDGIGNNNVSFYLQPSSYFTQYNEPDGYTRNLNIFGYNANYGGYSHSMWFRPSYDDYYGQVSFFYGYNTSCENVSDVYTDSMTLWLLDVLQNGYRQGGSSNLGYYSLNSNSLMGHISKYEGNYINYNNNTSYDFNYYYIYSSRKLLYYDGSFNANNNINNTSKYYKKVCLVNENKCYEPGDYFDSYMDLHPVVPEPVEPNLSLDFKNSLGTIYSNFSPNEFSNLSIEVDSNVNISNLAYYNNLDYNWSCYARVNNNNNYYSYVKFPYCDFETELIDDDDFKLRFYNFNIYDSNNNIISNFSTYDKLFLYINFQYKDRSLNTSLTNINIFSNSNIYYLDSYSGPIYENFVDLPLYSKLLLSSTSNTFSDFYVKVNSYLDNKYFLYIQQYNLDGLYTMDSVSYLGKNFQKFQLNKSLGIGYLIYQQISNQNSGLDLPNLDIIIFDDVIISLNSVSSNNFYYYDDTGTIVNNDLTINYDYQVNDNYDLSYYFETIIDFLSQYEEKIISLHNINQDFYDNCPSLLQSSIFVLFNLLCCYILYREIRR